VCVTVFSAGFRVLAQITENNEKFGEVSCLCVVCGMSQTICVVSFRNAASAPAIWLDAHELEVPLL
ncbi:MAG: hypothetical protein ACOVOA_15805, partial [Allorhizobium sp.]